MIETNIRIFGGHSQATQQKQSNSKMFKDFYRKYQQFDAVLVEEDTSQAVDRITQKILQGLLDPYSICFFSFATTKKRVFDRRRSSVRFEEDAGKHVQDQMELVKFTFGEMRKKIAADQRGLYMTCSLFEIRRESVKDLIRISSVSDKQALIAYQSSESCQQPTPQRISDIKQILDIHQRGHKLQEKFKSKRTETVCTVLKLSVCQTCSQVMINHVMFIDLSQYARSSASFEQGGALNLLDRFIQGKQTSNGPNPKHRLIHFLQTFLIQTSRLSFTFYTSIDQLPQQNDLLLYLSQLKVHSAVYCMNGLGQQQNTPQAIARLTNQLLLLRSKLQSQKKDFRNRIRNIQQLIGTELDIDKIGSKSLVSENNAFKKQKEAVDAIDSMMKATSEQERRIAIMENEVKEKKRETVRKESNHCRVLRGLKREVNKLEADKRQIEYNMRQKSVMLGEKERRQIQRLRESRERTFREYAEFATKLNKANRSDVLEPIGKKVDLKEVHSNALMESKENSNRQLAEHMESNKRLVEAARQRYEQELSEYEDYVNRQIAERKKLRDKNPKKQILMSVYTYYKKNSDLLQKLKTLLVNKNSIKLISDLQPLQLPSLPILYESLGHKYPQIQLLRTELENMSRRLQDF